MNRVQLSKHFTWEEAEITNHRKIDNTIPIRLESNILQTASNMELVRNVLNESHDCPILVSSWYRCEELNIAVGSSDKSFHPKGTAVDFICPQFGPPRKIVEHLMKHSTELLYDQLIFEFTWVHIGWDPSGANRGQVLTLLKSGGYAFGITDNMGNPFHA